MVLLKLLELLHAPSMPAFAKGSGQKDIDDLANLVFVEQIRAQAQHIAMIVLSRKPGGDFIVSESRANAADFVGRHRHADAAAIEENSRLAASVGHRLGRWNRKIGIIGGVG